MRGVEEREGGREKERRKGNTVECLSMLHVFAGWLQQRD